MRPIAEGVELLTGFPPFAINAYLMGDVLVDAGTRFDGRRLLRQLRGRVVTAHALTHAHPDHQGSSRRICEALGIPLMCGAGEVAAVETPGGVRDGLPAHPINRVMGPLFAGPPCPVARVLREGDEVAGFRVLETPGHRPGHLSFWRESDRVLILGDVLAHFNFLTGRPMLREPPTFFSTDPALNRASARRIAAMEPAVACFGHGPALRDPAKLAAFVATLAP